jgi:hypothetical protein
MSKPNDIPVLPKLACCAASIGVPLDQMRKLSSGNISSENRQYICPNRKPRLSWPIWPIVDMQQSVMLAGPDMQGSFTLERPLLVSRESSEGEIKVTIASASYRHALLAEFTITGLESCKLTNRGASRRTKIRIARFLCSLAWYVR